MDESTGIRPPDRALPDEIAEARREIERLRGRCSQLEAQLCRWDSVLRGANDGLWVWDLDQDDEVWWSPRFFHLLGHEDRAFRPTLRRFEELLHPDDRDRVMSSVSRRLASAEPFEVEYRLRSKSGEYRWFRAHGATSMDEKGEHRRVAGSVRDITELRLVEQELRASRERTRHLLDASHDFVFVHEIDENGRLGRFVEVNGYALEQLGYSLEEMRRKGPVDVVSDDEVSDRSSVVADLTEGRPALFERTLLTRTGERIPVEINARMFSFDGAPHVIAIARDIRERRHVEELEERMRLSQKMEALGQLAGGVAHDFNNLLYVMMGFAELAHARARPGSETAENLEQLLDAGERAAELVQRIQTFATRNEAPRRPLSIARGSSEIMGLLRATLPSSVDLEIEIDPNTPQILIQSSEIDQILVNLCTNAAQAMNGGRGSIRVGIHPPVGPTPEGADAWAEILVEDDGVGMDEDVRRRCFEPYFTTKPVGEGSGLGLATVHGLIASLGGDVRVESAPGQGTRFRVLLPGIAAATEEAAPPATSQRRPSRDPREARAQCRGRILIVDDEPQIARLLERHLGGCGFDVEVCMSPGAAVSLLEADAKAYDAFVIDETMPEIRGSELAATICAVHPDAPIVLCSGRIDEVAMGPAASLPNVILMAKPLRLGDLTERLRSLLAVRSVREA